MPLVVQSKEILGFMTHLYYLLASSHCSALRVGSRTNNIQAPDIHYICSKLTLTSYCLKVRVIDRWVIDSSV